MFKKNIEIGSHKTSGHYKNIGLINMKNTVRGNIKIEVT